MKPIVISYSLTGNNDALAAAVATQLGARHIRLSETGKRTLFTIGFDVIFNRIPTVQPPVATADGYDFIVFMGPVWMGHAATPLRAYFKHFKGLPPRYVFVSISGGAGGENPKLASELTKRLGKEPAGVIDLHIADLLPTDAKPDPKVTMGYRITEADVKNLTKKVLANLWDIIAKQADLFPLVDLPHAEKV